MKQITTVQEFYEDISQLIPERIQKEIGHFNVFRTEELLVPSSDRCLITGGLITK